MKKIFGIIASFPSRKGSKGDSSSVFGLKQKPTDTTDDGRRRRPPPPARYNTPVFGEVDESHIEVAKAKVTLAKLLQENIRQSFDGPHRFKRSASQAYEIEAKMGTSFTSQDSMQGPRKPGIIDDLRIVRKLGAGTFGSVWKAENTKTGEIVAIKKVLGQSFKEQAKFLKEAEILKLANHPNVLRFVGLYVKKGEVSEDLSEEPERLIPENLEPTMSIYLCTEYCRYGDLTKFLSNKLLKEIPWIVRLNLALDIARGLKHLHSQHIVHRDIKGENVLLKPKKKFDARNVDKTIYKHIQKQNRKMIMLTQKRKKYRGLGVKLGDEDNKSIVTDSSESNRVKSATTLSRMSKMAYRKLMRKRTQKEIGEAEAFPRSVYPVSLTPNGEGDDTEAEEYSPAEYTIARSPTVSSEEDVVEEIETLQTTSIYHQRTSMSSSDYDSDDTNADVRKTLLQDKHLENILNCRAILADVGLARFFKSTAASAKGPLQAHKAQTQERMTIRGTPWTMAPELIMNKQGYSTSSDIYSLGIVFLEISTRLPAINIPRKVDMSPDFEEIERSPVDPEPDIQKAVSQSVPLNVNNLKFDLNERTSSTMKRERPERAQTDPVTQVEGSTGLRQSYSSTCPNEFKMLCMKCCDMDPLKRPTAKEIVKELEEIVIRQRRLLAKSATKMETL